ncbi:Cytochrome c1 heme lyase [Entomophthora muscae]|uniref:Cytochrome c1 heme lyase n=1 Tax=Entomophthora muscae TaxID=34485 RepID=A0ACC2SMR7_9FUNG|nr:Cytochrome c1 heme lyase [Entomophthora muscae]
MSSEKYQTIPQETSSVKQCPIDHNASKSTWLEIGKSVNSENKSSKDNEEASKGGCPIDHNSSVKIDPSNYMPKGKEFNLPTSNQKVPLNQEREISSIPKAEGQSESHWVYPSQQMFFNAMKRKNWDPSEEDMKVIVPIHNAVNERAWNMILKYEEMYKSKIPGTS